MGVRDGLEGSLHQAADLDPALAGRRTDTAVAEEPLLSPWQRGEAHFDPLGRDAR